MRKVNKEVVNDVINNYIYNPNLTPGDVITRILKLDNYKIDIKSGEIIETVLNNKYKNCIFEIMEKLKMRCSNIKISDIELLLNLDYGIRDLNAYSIKRYMDEIIDEGFDLGEEYNCDRIRAVRRTLLKIIKNNIQCEEIIKIIEIISKDEEGIEKLLKLL